MAVLPALPIIRSASQRRGTAWSVASGEGRRCWSCQRSEPRVSLSGVHVQPEVGQAQDIPPLKDPVPALLHRPIPAAVGQPQVQIPATGTRRAWRTLDAIKRSRTWTPRALAMGIAKRQQRRHEPDGRSPASRGLHPGLCDRRRVRVPAVSLNCADWLDQRVVFRPRPRDHTNDLIPDLAFDWCSAIQFVSYLSAIMPHLTFPISCVHRELRENDFE